MKHLTLYESIFLLTILRLEGNAYGVIIREEISKVTQRRLSYGTLYSYLDQLYKKGYLSKTIGDPTPERGGRRKTFYRLTPLGMSALKAARELQRAIWSDLPEFAFDES